MLGYSREGHDFTDPIQGIEGRFLAGPGPRLELVRQLQDGGVLTAWLNRRVLLYHLAFETADLAGAIEVLKARRGGKLVVAPVPAVAFGGRHIAFVMLANGLLVEFISSV
jgi:methylmalonyl-CoA/ethylmalonyl-CoA epimerase